MLQLSLLQTIRDVDFPIEEGPVNLNNLSISSLINLSSFPIKLILFPISLLNEK